MNNSSINIKAMEDERRALTFIDKIERENNRDDKVKLFIDFLTYYDKVNARVFSFFCMEVLTHQSIYGRNQMLEKKIIELQEIMNQRN